MNGSKDQNEDYTSISLTKMEFKLNKNDKKLASSGINWIDKKLLKLKKASKEFLRILLF